MAINDPLDPAPWSPARKLALAYGGGLALWALLVAAAQADERLGAAALEWSRTPLLLVAVPVAWAAAWRHAEARTRRAWALIGLGYLAVAGGDLIDGWRAFRGLPSLPLSNAFWLGYFPLVLAGVLYLPRVFRNRLDRTRFVIDAVIVATCGGLLIWALVLRPGLDSATGAVDPWLALAYPLGDLISALAIALVLLRADSGVARRAHSLLALSFVASFSGDLVWSATFALGLTTSKLVPQLLWNLWAAAFLAAALCAWLDSSARAPEPVAAPGTSSLAQLPYLALVAGYLGACWLAYLGDARDLRAALVAIGLMATLVIVRMWLTQVEHERLLTETLQRRGERRLAALIEHSSDALVVTDAALAVQYASPSAGRLLGLHAAPNAKPIWRTIHPDDAPGLHQYLDACVRGECRHATLVLRVASEGSGWRTVETQVDNLLDNPDVGSIVLTLRDVSERHALEEQLRFQAFHDALTGLPNRELFLDRLERALSRVRQGQAQVAVALIDLDRFQHLNDQLGHRLADQVLAQVAERLRASLAGADTLARFGGDDFAVLFETLQGAEEARTRADGLRRVIATPLVVGGQRLQLSASIGLAHSASAQASEPLLRYADLALQQVRAAGGDGVDLFDSGRHQGSVERLGLEAELPHWIADGAFVVQFEPVIALQGGRVAGLNVRLAWRDPERAVAPMAAVVAAAAEAGRIAELGSVLRTGLAQDLRALMRYLPDSSRLWLTLRLHAHELRDTELATQLAAMLRAVDLPPSRLLVRIGAADFPRSPGAAERALQPLVDVGLRLAAADIGSASSGFDLIAATRLHALFLARPLIAGPSPGSRGEALTRAAVAGARALELEVIAPGVGDARAIPRLAELGVHYAYGPGIAPLLSFQRLLPWLGARFAEEAATPA